MLANLQLDIDCDRETERIFSLLSSNSTKLQDMEGQCLFMSIYFLSQSIIGTVVLYILTSLLEILTYLL